MADETHRHDSAATAIRERKRQIRRAMLSLRQALPEVERLARSRCIWRRLTALRCYQAARVILGYMAMDKEVLTDGLLRQAIAAGKLIVLPVVEVGERQLALYAIRNLEHDVAPGFRRILEPQRHRTRPVDVEEVELALVPGVAFDAQGGRLGFGAGFYDRLLSRFPEGIPKIGIAFDFQVLPRLPRLSHDIALDAIVTESRVISCRPLSTHDEAATVAGATSTHRGEGEV
ncbi:MAG TPA: 5-formyltetrahydrofolate cyclo-ligase [Alphaproteobacteria bacterium]|nr:5-formyltetrahydrofolate cyclo-ligase [Alphaproteobacteria bacterium]